MSDKEHRILRVAEAIKRELILVLRDEIRDPRINTQDFVITSVEVSRDLYQAKIFVSKTDNSQDNNIIENLNRASSFLRTQLGKTLHMRTIPILKFLLDISREQDERINQLLDEYVIK